MIAQAAISMTSIIKMGSQRSFKAKLDPKLLILAETGPKSTILT